MASIQVRRGRWHARIKVGSRWLVRPLGLAAPGNKRVAQERAHLLQVQLNAGVLDEAVRSWLGNRAADALLKAARAPVVKDAARFPDWPAALGGWLDATAQRDTVRLVPGRLPPVPRTRQTRERVLGGFVAWAGDQPLRRASMTDLVRAYLKERCTPDPGNAKCPDGWRANTARKAYIHLCSFADWLHERGVVARLDRKEVREVLPREEVVDLELPDAAEDVAVLVGLQSHAVERKNAAACWALWVVVRGLGCRPSEAISLTWRTVDLERGIVRFLSTKEGRRRLLPHRTAPVLLEWARQGLLQLRQGADLDDPVCKGVHGNPWSNENSSCHRLDFVLKALGLPKLRLKQAQKLYIRQLIRLGFSPHVIAAWTGHTLSIQERHYCEEAVYLPTGHGEPLGEFDTLTALGRQIRSPG